jgi:tRNA threonylcarbamoyladenosine modification (KEOPS) complex  Pcc1 subunit
LRCHLQITDNKFDQISEIIYDTIKYKKKDKTENFSNFELTRIFMPVMGQARRSGGRRR